MAHPYNNYYNNYLQIKLFYNMYNWSYLIQFDTDKRFPGFTDFDQVKICRGCGKSSGHAARSHPTRKWGLESTKFLSVK